MDAWKTFSFPFLLGPGKNFQGRTVSFREGSYSITFLPKKNPWLWNSTFKAFMVAKLRENFPQITSGLMVIWQPGGWAYPQKSGYGTATPKMELWTNKKFCSGDDSFLSRHFQMPCSFLLCFFLPSVWSFYPNPSHLQVSLKKKKRTI